MKIWIYVDSYVSVVIKDIGYSYYSIPVYRLFDYLLRRRKNKKVKIRGELFRRNSSFSFSTCKFPPIKSKSIIHFMKADHIYFHEILQVLREKEIKP